MTNEETKKAADELIQLFAIKARFHIYKSDIVELAIASTENTIKVLDEIGANETEFNPILARAIIKQTELLNELKTRL